MSDNKIKTICFYLPQFHTIPENDAAHGEGFTEWTNVRKTKPLFENHNQPRVPLDNNYYCLLDDGVMEKQAALAKEKGIYGFCYYHYWFKDGKKLLEKPLENMLQNKKIDIPFCLCWANENWTKRWDGGNNEVIVEQDYGDLEDLKKHVDYLCEFFKDERYITIDNEPVLLIYKPELIPNLKKIVKLIRKQVKKNGFQGVKLVVQYPKFYLDGAMLSLFDYYIEFEPQFILSYIHDSGRGNLQRKVKAFLLELGMKKVVAWIENARTKKAVSAIGTVGLEHRDYSEDWEAILAHDVKSPKQIAGAFVDWDNTPRNSNGRVYDGTTPEKFGKYMTALYQKIKKEYNQQMVFVNAWNEWAEGAYLEPDEKNGYAYIDALEKALRDTKNR